MKLVSKSLFLVLLLLIGCAKIDRRAHVVAEKKVTSDSVVKFEQAKQGVLRVKNSLRVVLMDLKFSTETEKAVVLDSRAALLYQNQITTWSSSQLASLHAQLLPELYDLLNIIDEKRFKLVVLCRRSIECDLIRANMKKGLKHTARFIFSNNFKALMNIDPQLVISDDKKLFVRLAESSSEWKNWRDVTYSIKPALSSQTLSPLQWAQLLPSVNEF